MTEAMINKKVKKTGTALCGPVISTPMVPIVS
jgi:hypothetical protein